MALSDIQKKILEKLYSARIWVSTYWIADKIKHSWEAVDDALVELAEQEFILHRAVGSKDLWQFNVKKHRELKERHGF